MSLAAHSSAAPPALAARLPALGGSSSSISGPPATGAGTPAAAAAASAGGTAVSVARVAKRRRHTNKPAAFGGTTAENHLTAAVVDPKLTQGVEDARSLFGNSNKLALMQTLARQGNSRAKNAMVCYHAALPYAGPASPAPGAGSATSNMPAAPALVVPAAPQPNRVLMLAEIRQFLQSVPKISTGKSSGNGYMFPDMSAQALSVFKALASSDAETRGTAEKAVEYSHAILCIGGEEPTEPNISDAHAALMSCL